MRSMTIPHPLPFPLLLRLHYCVPLTYNIYTEASWLDEQNTNN